MSGRIVVRMLRFAPVVALAFALAGAAFGVPSNKWRLECSGGADSDGVIVLHVVPKGGVALVVEVKVAKGTGENAVARRIRDVLKASLPKGAYSVEVDDGEDVLVKRRGSTPVFDLLVRSNSVKGVRVNPDRE